MSYLLPLIALLALQAAPPRAEPPAAVPGAPRAVVPGATVTPPVTPPVPPSTTRPADVLHPIRVATWNVENWHTHFTAERLKGKIPKEVDGQDDPVGDALREVAREDDEDNWEIGQVFLDPAFSPDVVVIEEGPSQANLEQFNKEWLKGLYETVIVFPGNSTRVQTVGMMLKPGFKAVERKDQYYQMPDPVGNDRGGKLFARGPAFVLVESPGGYRFWVGVTHQKSKGGNDVDVTKWRNREAMATHQIMRELHAQGPKDVVLLGDMNDELGVQSYELEGGGDAIENLCGPAADGFVLLTRPLAETGQATFMGYWKDRYRSMIDHVVMSREMTPAVKDVRVFDSPWARVASDHLPVYVDLQPTDAK